MLIDKDAQVSACALDFAKRMNLCTPKKLTVVRDGGKPFFQEWSEIHFSVSHSEDIWACGIATQTLGLDIQRHARCNQSGIAKRFFHVAEYQHLEKNGYGDFFDIWAAKESYVKFTGSGIDDEFSSFSVVKDGKLTEELKEVCFQPITLLPGYSVCICCAVKAQVHIIDVESLVEE